MAGMPLTSNSHAAVASEQYVTVAEFLTTPIWLQRTLTFSDLLAPAASVPSRQMTLLPSREPPPSAFRNSTLDGIASVTTTLAAGASPEFDTVSSNVASRPM